MKVLYVNRDQSYGGHSVEELFSTLQKQFTEIDFTNYYYNNKKSLFSNLKEIKTYKADIIHFTSGMSNLTLFLPSRTTIFTIHDINRYLNDLSGLRKIIYYLYYLYPLKRLKNVTAISQTVKNNLIKHIGIKPDRIHVINNPYPDDFLFSPKEFNANCPRILTIGTNKWKNLANLTEAIEGIKCKLVIIGRLTPSQIEKLEAHHIDYENYFNIERAAMYEEYKKADMVSFVSLYEGFGMPIIEAQAVGRCVITSNISSMPEIAKDSALLVNPYEVKEIKDAILEIKTNPDLREELILKGRKNIESYSVSLIKNNYLHLYNSIVKNNT